MFPSELWQCAECLRDLRNRKRVGYVVPLLQERPDGSLVVKEQRTVYFCDNECQADWSERYMSDC